MPLVGVIITVFWIILALSWIIGAFLFRKPIAKKPDNLQRFIQTLFLIVSIVLLVKYDIFNFLSIVLVRQSTIIDIASILLCILGLLISIWARITLKDNWSGKVVLKKQHELIKNGPYRLIRHPIYTGFLLMFIGTALAVGRISGFLGFIILLIGLSIKLKQEEDLMTNHFKKKYLNYKKTTKALIPYII